MGKNIVQNVGTIDRGLDKTRIENLASENARQIIDSGKYDLLKVYIELKRYETYLKALITELKDPVLTKAAENGQSRFKYNEAQVRIQHRIQCDFSIDASWSELQRQIDALTKQRKVREKMLKQKKVVETVDEETGEVLAEMELPRKIRQLLTIRL